MFTHLKKFTIILALQKNFFIHSSVLHASHSSTVMKRSERSSGHRFSGEVAGHSSKLHIPPAADQVPQQHVEEKSLWPLQGDVLCYYCYCSVESWKWRMFMFDPMLLVSLKKRCFFHVQCQDLIMNMSETWKTKLLPGTTANQLEPIFSESDYHIISLTSRNLWIQPVVISDFTGRQAGTVKVPSLG